MLKLSKSCDDSIYANHTMIIFASGIKQKVADVGVRPECAKEEICIVAGVYWHFLWFENFYAWLIIQTPLLRSYVRKSAWSTGRVNIGLCSRLGWNAVTDKIPNGFLTRKHIAPQLSPSIGYHTLTASTSNYASWSPNASPRT